MLGTTIAHYKITAKLGQGGMGEVYRATDTKLDREVAIKVLTKSFVQDKERLARFDREAKMLATLNHPAIAGIYGLEHDGDSKALAPELVEGEDLSQSLKQGPLAVDDVLEIGMQIAEALEAAHEKSIIHRDLKPGNIKLTHNGRVKVLDFGLAKALSTESGTTQSYHPETSETITDAFTQPGTILGTVTYMSPEQARGKHVDHRSDIWAFGCVLYECLTGKRAFQGADISETMASIIKSEPDWSFFPEDTPPSLNLLIRKCLEKDRRKRLQHIGDARIDLEPYLLEHARQVVQISETAANPSPPIKPFKPLPALCGALCLLATGYGLSWIQEKGFSSNTTPQSIRQLNVSSGADVEILKSCGTAIRCSPVGDILGFIRSPDEKIATSQIYLRRLDQNTANPIPGTEGADQFCFSPDGTRIAFRNQIANEIQVIPIIGGIPQKVCNSKYPGGMDWSKEDDHIYFADEFSPIYKVAPTGGNPTAITELVDGEKSHRWPSSVGKGKGILFTAGNARGAWHRGTIVLKRLHDGTRSHFPHRGTHARLLPEGFLLYVKFNRLFASRVTMESSEFPKDATPINLGQNVASFFGGVAHFDVSNRGELVYLDSNTAQAMYTIDWVYRDGRIEDLLPPKPYSNHRLSPNGNAVTYTMKGDVWVYDIDRRRAINLTYSEENFDLNPMWSPSGKSVFFSRFNSSGVALSWKRIDGSNEVQSIAVEKGIWFPWAFQPDGHHIIGYLESRDGLADQKIQHLKGDDTLGWVSKDSDDLLNSPANETDGRYSHDGRWLAFSSDKFGTHQIYVMNANAKGARIPVSSSQWNSRYPVWSKANSEILFSTRTDAFRAPFAVTEDLPQQVYIAPFSENDDTLSFGTPIPWPEAICYGQFCIHPDGEKVMVRRKVTHSKRNVDQINLFVGFSNYVQKLFTKDK